MNRFTATLAALVVALLVLPAVTLAQDEPIRKLSIAHLHETRTLVNCTTTNCALRSMTRGFDLVTRIEKRASSRMDNGEVGRGCIDPAARFLASVRKSFVAGRAMIARPTRAHLQSVRWATLAVDATLIKLSENC